MTTGGVAALLAFARRRRRRRRQGRPLAPEHAAQLIASSPDHLAS